MVTSSTNISRTKEDEEELNAAYALGQLQLSASYDTYIINPLNSQQPTPSGLPTVNVDQLIGNSNSLTTANASDIDALSTTAAAPPTDGDDVLRGTVRGDTLAGGKGNDTYIVNHKDDLVIEQKNEGDDLVKASIDYKLTANVEHLTLTGSKAIDGTGNELNNVIEGNAAANVLDGGAGDDQLFADAGKDTLQGGSGNDYLDGGVGIDSLVGGTGDDTYVVDNVSDSVVEKQNEGNDTVRASVNYTLATGGNIENLLLTGNAINGTGNELKNNIIGNTRNNILDGGDGIDTLIGGKGDDTYLVDNASDSVVEKQNEGNDTVRASVSYTLTGSHIENLTLTGSAISGTGNDYLDGGAGADVLIGGDGDDTYVVDNQNDVVIDREGGNDTVIASVDYTLAVWNNIENLTLTGSAISGTGNEENNNIIGNAGNNILDGGTGADNLIGGTGDDTYLVDNASDSVVEKQNEGNDTVRASVSYTLTGSHIENLTLIGRAFSGTGNEFDNSIVGNVGNNILDGGTGADNLIGGIGDDTYLVDNLNDVVVELDNEGSDTIRASVNYSLVGSYVEYLTLTGSAISGTGNELKNNIIGNAENNILDGGAGNDYLDGNAGEDTLIGGDGNDYLYGGTGADMLIGGLGDDVYHVDNSGDLIVEKAGEGNDTISVNVDYTLSAGSNIENLYLYGSAIRGTGDEGDNWIGGSDADNILDGGAGADTMYGGYGNDIFIVDNENDVALEFISWEGNSDTVRASVNYILTAGNYIENLILTGNAISGTGNELDNSITGNAENNILDGGDGADYLDGGAGLDSLIGGKGDDTFVVDGLDGLNDNLIEKQGEGTDTVKASISYTLVAGSNIEYLTLTGSDSINGTGNELNNRIYGNAGDNTLYGGAGNDTLNGGAGSDTYVFAALDGTANGGLGLDTIVSGGFVSNLDGQFEAEEDVLDLTGMFVDNAGNAVGVNAGNIDQYLRMDGTTLQIDRDGGGNSFTNLVNLTATNITSANLDELYTAGQILA